MNVQDPRSKNRARPFARPNCPCPAPNLISGTSHAITGAAAAPSWRSKRVQNSNNDCAWTQLCRPTHAVSHATERFNCPAIGTSHQLLKKISLHRQYAQQLL
eukprot:450075-Pleurochrysis_carterae.AAC.4